MRFGDDKGGGGGVVAGGDGRQLSLVAEEVAEKEARGQSGCHRMGNFGQGF